MAKSTTRKLAEEAGKTPDPTETFEVRVLTDCQFGRADDVARLTVEQLEAAVDAGIADDHPDAVAYARTLPQNRAEPEPEPDPPAPEE